MGGLARRASEIDGDLDDFTIAISVVFIHECLIAQVYRCSDKTVSSKAFLEPLLVSLTRLWPPIAFTRSLPPINRIINSSLLSEDCAVISDRH